MNAWTDGPAIAAPSTPDHATLNAQSAVAVPVQTDVTHVGILLSSLAQIRHANVMPTGMVMHVNSTEEHVIQIVSTVVAHPPTTALSV